LIATSEGYDVIGDVHGHAKELKCLLKKMGYRESEFGWYHPTRIAVFVGDLIDKGPEQIEVINIVRSMVDHGKALAVLGNHEFNAVSWLKEIEGMPGEYLRPHTSKNRRQHQAFLDQVIEGSPIHEDTVDWLAGLPVYLDLPEFRVVHACWNQPDIEAISAYLNNDRVMTRDAWQFVAREGTVLFKCIENILKGPETELPRGFSFKDQYGNNRTKVRVQWWCGKGDTYQEVAMVSEDQKDAIPDTPVRDLSIDPYEDCKPVFIGHYWLSGQPEFMSAQVCCLDYSVASDGKDGKLCAYRWNCGDESLDAGRFVWVHKDEVRKIS